MRQPIVFLVICILALSTCGEKAQFPYSPATWRTPICFINDWQKSLVDESGDLAYDFGPGPYAKPKTEISFRLRDGEMERLEQSLYNPRVPIVLTSLKSGKVDVRMTAFALADSAAVTPVILSNETVPVKRYKGFVGCTAWTVPDGDTDPAFRNVAWGTNRPIQYGLEVNRGSAKRVAMGFCDGYRKKDKITRVMRLTVEGADVQVINLLKTGDRNQPQVFLFDGRDKNRDGILNVEVCAAHETVDPNTLINAIWVFPENFTIDIPDLIAGKLTSQADVLVDCGAEPQLKQLPLRRDAVIAEFEGKKFTPVIHIATNRKLEYDENNGTVRTDGRLFLSMRPRPKGFRVQKNEYLIEFSPETQRIEFIAHHAHGNFSEPEVPDLSEELRKAVLHWENEVDLPVDRIVVPDSRIQALVESAMRVLMQVSELVGGYPQFQPGPSVYRGFWASDGMWDADAALLLGDYEMADQTVKRYIEHQTPNGRIEIMSPSLLHRETSHFIWLVQRYAALTRDKQWLERNFQYLQRAVFHIKELRKKASTDASQPYYKLMPPGLTDGGIGGVNAEFGAVYWSLIGLKSAAESAEMLGKTGLAREWMGEFNDLKDVFYHAAERDMQVDGKGNRFLPMKMMPQDEVKYPQRGQSQLSQTVFPGKIFDLNDPFISGLFDIYDMNLKQGLVMDTGWLKDGVWPFHATHRGLAELWVGRGEKAWDALFAYADHSAPTYLWVEEQHPKDIGTRVSGDCPQTNANAQFIRLLRHLLAIERGTELHLLSGLPREWIFPGAELKLKEIPTMFGELTFNLSIAGDGKSAELHTHLDVHSGAEGEYVISLKTLKERGFSLAERRVTSNEITADLSETLHLTFSKK